jgi:site-specific recombinase XerD
MSIKQCKLLYIPTLISDSILKNGGILVLLDDFLKACKRRGRTSRTIEGYRSSVGEFLRMYPEPELVTQEDLEDYLDHLLDRGLVYKTIKGYFSSISTLYEF